MGNISGEVKWYQDKEVVEKGPTEIPRATKKEPIKIDPTDFISFKHQVESAYKITPDKNLGDMIVLLDMLNKHLN